MIIRRHYASPEGTATTVGLTAEKSSADEINLIERKLFFTTANAHFKVGSSAIWLLQSNSSDKVGTFLSISLVTVVLSDKMLVTKSNMQRFYTTANI